MEKETSSLNFAWQKQTPYTKLLHSIRALDSTRANQVENFVSQNVGYKTQSTNNLLSRENLLLTSKGRILLKLHYKTPSFCQSCKQFTVTDTKILHSHTWQVKSMFLHLDVL